MPVTINYKDNSSKKKASNLILFSDEKFTISSLKKYISNNEYQYISDLIKTRDLKGKIQSFDISSKKKVILIALKKNIENSEVENLGAKFYDEFKHFKQNEYNLNSETISNKLKNIVGYFLHGVKLKSYKFDKYLSKKK